MTLPYKMVVQYSQENKEYKDNARDILCEHLGFEPDILKSLKAELYLRHLLKKIDDGKLPKERLKEGISFCVKIVKKWSAEHWPNPLPCSPEGEPDFFDLKWIREIALNNPEVQRLIKEKNQAIAFIKAEPQGSA